MVRLVMAMNVMMTGDFVRGKPGAGFFTVAILQGLCLHSPVCSDHVL